MTEDRANEMLVTGALFGILAFDHRVEVDISVDDDGMAGPALLVRLPGIMKSQYRLTVEIVPGTEMP